jgi:hypothetical protein
MVAQDLDDAALGYFAVATMFDHPLKLNLQRLHADDPALHFGKLSASNAVSRIARFVRRVRQPEQVPDRAQWEAKLSAMPDECQPFNVPPIVSALIAGRAAGPREQADLLVVANCLHLAAGRPRSIANGVRICHKRPLEALVAVDPI